MAPPTVVPKVVIRSKELEQSHICLGASSYPQNHDARYASYVLNTILGGSMSSRLFQNIREKRGLCYSVFSGINAYRDAGSLTVYAGCANEAVGEVIDLTVEEMKVIRQTPVADTELRRAKDHLKGSLMLSLENTASRMSHLARQEIYFERHFGLDDRQCVLVSDVVVNRARRMHAHQLAEFRRKLFQPALAYSSHSCVFQLRRPCRNAQNHLSRSPSPFGRAQG